MKNIKKVFYIIIGGLICSTVGVLAATLINSSDVIYDISEGHTTRDTVKGALDELYERVNTPSGYTEEQYNTALESCPQGKLCQNFYVGAEISIGDEIFYTISYNSTNKTIALIAKYNLLVGYKCNDSSSYCTEISTTTSGYGRQSSTALGCINGNTFPAIGVIGFKSSDYWNGNIGAGKKYPGSYTGNPNYPNVFDTGSKLYEPVQKYKSYLESIIGKGKIIEARLLTYEEATALGCGTSSSNLCPDFISNTTFWLGSAKSNDKVWEIKSKYLKYLYGDYMYNNTGGGVRPVIVISSSDI